MGAYFERRCYRKEEGRGGGGYYRTLKAAAGGGLLKLRMCFTCREKTSFICTKWQNSTLGSHGTTLEYIVVLVFLLIYVQVLDTQVLGEMMYV